MKIMIVNSKTTKTQNNFGKNQKSSSWFYSLLCYSIHYMRKCPIHVTWAQGKALNTLASLGELSKKRNMTNNLQQ